MSFAVPPLGRCESRAFSKKELPFRSWVLGLCPLGFRAAVGVLRRVSHHLLELAPWKLSFQRAPERTRSHRWPRAMDGKAHLSEMVRRFYEVYLRVDRFGGTCLGCVFE